MNSKNFFQPRETECEEAVHTMEESLWPSTTDRGLISRVQGSKKKKRQPS